MYIIKIKRIKNFFNKEIEPIDEYATYDAVTRIPSFWGNIQFAIIFKTLEEAKKESIRWVKLLNAGNREKSAYDLNSICICKIELVETLSLAKGE